MARHGTRRGYKDGCRCDDCRDAQRLYQQRYRQHRVACDVGDLPTPEPGEPGPVEAAVKDEIGDGAARRVPVSLRSRSLWQGFWTTPEL